MNKKKTSLYLYFSINFFNCFKGPFRDPLEVRKQRYRPFSPSLRVETDYECLEVGREKMKAKEWVERINDDM